MQLREFGKLLFLNKHYLLTFIILALAVGYFNILNESNYQVASFSIYAKLNFSNEKFENAYDEVKNTFFVIKTAESFIDSIRFWLMNDLKFKNVKISSRKITPQHLFIQLKQRGNKSLISVKDTIINEIKNRQSLLVNDNLKIFSIEASDYKEYPNRLNYLLVMSLSLIIGIFGGILFILLKHYFQLPTTTKVQP